MLMTIQHAFRPVLLVLIVGLFSTIALAQQTCAPLVNRALEALETNCTDVTRNQVCYGYDRIEATFAEEMPAGFFSQPADVSDLALIRTLQTAPLDETRNEWGVALMKMQANLPGTLPGQNVVMVVMGDAHLTSAEAENPMQAFYFTTGIGSANCEDAPDTLVIQSPKDAVVNLTINEAEIQLASTAILHLVDDGEAFELTMADGEAMIDGRMMVPEGHWAKIPLNTFFEPQEGFHGITDEMPDCRPTPDEDIAVYQQMMDAMPTGAMNYAVDSIEHDERGCMLLEE